MEPPNIIDDGGSREKFLDTPYDERWELLKPTIIHMYLKENTTIVGLVERMKKEYSFYAQKRQYQTHFSKWGIRKRIITKEKSAAITALGKRSRNGATSTSSAKIEQGGFEKNVDRKNLKRYINESIRQSEPWAWTPGLFLRYDLPYTALIRSLGAHDYASPSAAGPPTPSYLTIKSPEQAASPSTAQNHPSPTMQLVLKKVLLDRARLFLEGRESDLMAQISRDERKSIATWLHDFWVYSFMTAKYWGRGPKVWTLESINFKSFTGQHAPPTPDQGVDEEQASQSLSPHGANSFLGSPTQLCRWSIHYHPPSYERIRSPPVVHDQAEGQFDIDDESTWQNWNWTEVPLDLPATIQQGFQKNVFTTIQPEKLPLDTGAIMNAVRKSPDELAADAFGFAIMSRNLEALYEILDDERPESFSKIFPFHLATAFLDGAKTCCGVMEALVNNLDKSHSIAVNYVDSFGHTVLDSIFITILRSYSTVSPHAVSDSFNGRSCFPGQDVDPCGRWDADSPCIRKLHALGRPTIPRHWKHMFCHTAIQAICHCISMIFLGPSRPNINTPSGLFTKRCSHCGLQLKVGPLHALVLTAFYLANEGMPGENLFGMIACLVCLLTFRADPRTTTDISIPALLGQDSPDACQHAPMNAAELSIGLMRDSWSPEIKLGWKTLTAILQHDIALRQGQILASNSENEEFGQIYIPNENSDDGWLSEDEHITDCGHVIHHYGGRQGGSVYCGNQLLGRIWAVIQAELLTYRRLSEDDLWLSPEFSLSCVLRGLEENDDRYILQLHVVSNGGVAENRLKAHSHCGLFNSDHPGCVRREEACASYYGNLDDWKRTTFIGTNSWDW